MAAADRDILISLVNSYVCGGNGSSRFISSNNHGTAADKTACDTITITVDKDSIMEYQPISGDERHMFTFNHSSHPYINMTIEGKIIVKDRATDSANPFVFILVNNPSKTIVNVTETASLSFDIPDKIASDRLTWFTTGTNIVTIHENAIIDEHGALTIAGLAIARLSEGVLPAVTIVAADNTNQALFLGLTGYTKTTDAVYNVISFMSEGEDVVYYGNLQGMFYTVEDGATISMIANTTMDAKATLDGKAVTVMGGEDLTLTVTSTIYVANGGTLTVKDMTIAAAKGDVFYVTTAGNTLTLDGVTVNYTAAAKSNFIGLPSGGKLALEITNSTFTSTNEARIVYVANGAALTSMKYENVTSTNGVLAMVNGATATIGSATAPAEIIDCTGGLVFYAYTGTIYANIYGGTFTTLVYGGDDSTNTLDIKINPTGDKTTTFTRATASDASHYSAWAHLHPAADTNADISFVIRNTVVTDTGAAPLIAVRDKANLSISVENSTFTLSGTKLTGFSEAYGVTFGSDEAARLFGYGARIGAEGESKYYNNVYYALTDVANGGTITIVADVKQTGEFGLNKTVTITSPEGEKYTVTTTANVPFYFQTNANLTVKNVTYDLGIRFGRFDGNSTLTFGDGANILHKDAIFLYNNGNCTAQPVYTIDIQKGAVITSTGTLSYALIYSNAVGAAKSNVTVKIAGTVTTKNGAIVQDVDGATHGVSIYRVYIDATSAVINTGTAVWGAAGGKDLAIFYNGTFESNAAAAEWAYGTGAYCLTINNDPAAEYKYSMTYDSQFIHTQHNVLNTNGGEIWQLRTNANGAGIYQTMQFINEGTVTLKSYNGALISMQNATRFRVVNTTLILDGITIRLDGGSSIGIHGGSEAAPSVLKLVNGATVTGAAANAGQLIYFMADNGGQYSHLYVDETSTLSTTAPSAALAGNNHVIWVHGGWANGSITIKGTVTSAANAANVYLLTLQGNGTNALTLDGAKLSITGTATGTAALVQVLGGCMLEYENLNNSTLDLEKATAATKHTLYVRGAITFKGLSADDAAAEAAKYGLGVRFGNVFSSVISTAIINQIPEGTKAEIVLADTAYIYDTVQIFNRDVTFVGKNNANYDLIFEGAANSTAFLVVTNGTLTFKNMNIRTNAQLVAYSGTNNLTFANGVIEINLVNTDVTATLTGAYSGSATLFGSTAHAPKNSSNTYVQANSVTLNVDADSVINFTSPYAGTVYFISFNHNSHKWVYANIDGELNVNVTSDTDHETMLFRSNNPARTQITISETAKVTATLSATRKTNGKAYITSCTGGNSTENKLTMHLSAISKDGALTVEGMKLFSAWTTASTFTALVIADDNTMSDVLMSWLGRNSNGGGSNTPFDEYPLAVSLALNGKVYYSSLGGVIALIPDGATATIQISSNMSSGGTINIVNKTITLEGVGATKPTLTLTGNPAFQLGDNSHLILKNLDIIATSNFILTNGTDTKATTKIDIEAGTTIDIRNYGGAYFFRAGSVGILTMNIKAGTSVKLLTDGTVRDGAVQGMFDFTSYSNKVAEGSVINVDGQVIYGLKFKGEVAGNSRSAMFKVGDTTIDIIFTANADIQLLHENAIGGTWNAIVCLDSTSANTIVTFNGCKISLADQCAIYGLNGTNFPGTYEVNNITLQSTGSFLVSDYAAAGGVNSTTVKFRNFNLNGNALTQNDKLPYMLLANIGFASESEAFANAAYFTLTPGTYSNLGGAIEAAEDGATIYVNTNLVLTSATIANKSLTFEGATDGIVITNKSSGYLFTLGTNGHLTIKNLTYEGNFFAQFTAAANTSCSLTLGENAHVIGGALVDKAYIMGGSGLYGSAVITISASASIIRPDTNVLTSADDKSPSIYRFETRGAYTLNVYGELKNLTAVADGVRASATIGYCNSANGMIVNIYDGAEIEALNDSTAHNGYYQGVFYFASYGYNRYEFNVYGGTIISHGINSLAYFGNNYATIRLEGNPAILMNQATYNVFCLQPNANYPLREYIFLADLEADASLELNGRLFCWGTASPAVSKLTAGKFFTDDNAAIYGAGYRVEDENGVSWYTVSLGAAAALSRNGGTIYLVGNMTDVGSSAVLDKYLFLKPTKPGLTITLNGSTLFSITSGTKESPVRMYIEGITFAGSSSGVLFALSGNANGIFVLDNCAMTGTAGVIKMTGTSTASVTLINGNYTMKNTPFYVADYSVLTLDATNITFNATGTGNDNTLFHVKGQSTATFNIKGGSATTAFHTFYTMDTSVVYVDVENFNIVTNQWAFGSQSSTTWYANLKNVNVHANNTTTMRVYAIAGSYFNIMGGNFSTSKKDGTNKAVLTFGNALTVNIYDAYVNSPYMSAVSGLTNTVNITIYGGTYIYSGTEANYAPIMLPHAGNLTVKGGTFINQSGKGPVFSNVSYTANLLKLEAYNAISNSSNLTLNFSTVEGSAPSASLGAYGRLTLNTLMMQRGARPEFVGTAGAMTFKSTVSASAYEYMQSLSATGNVTFGMLVVPTSILNSGVDFTHAGLKNYSSIFGDKLVLGEDYFDYTAIAELQDDGCLILKATHSGIEEADFETKYSVVFYAKYEVKAQIGTDTDGNPVYGLTGTDAYGNPVDTAVVYRYADYEESQNARSLAEVAYAAYNNPAENFSAAQLELLSTWCGEKTEQKTLDIYLIAGGSNAAGNTSYNKQLAETLINHQCAACGHIADSAAFAASNYTCVNELVHGKPLTLKDDEYVCDCGYKCAAADVTEENPTCPETHVCGAKKDTFKNVLKESISNVFYSGIISQRAPQDFASSIVYATASQYAPIGSVPSLGLGWAGATGPEYGMALELAKHYTDNEYAAIMKYAFNDAALVAEDENYSNFSGELYKNFMQMVTDQIAVYTDLGYKVNVAGLYWMQGEADLANADAYAAALQQLIANIRADLSQITETDLSNMPVVVGEVATFTGTTGNANRVALKNAQNSVSGVLIDNTSLYMADTNGIFVDAQNVTDTGARVAATILKTMDDEINIPEIENTTEILDSEGNPIPGMEGHTSLAMSLIAAPNGATITLKNDQTVYTSMNVTNRDDIVIDGDGKTITVLSDAPAIALQNANVTLNNVVINHSGTSAAITLDQSSALTVEEGTQITAERAVIEMTGNASKLVINGGTFTTTSDDASQTDAIIRTTNANVTINGGDFTAADGSSILVIDKNASHKLIVNITAGSFTAADKQVEKKNAEGNILVGEYETIEAVAFVNNCPTAILVIDPEVLALHPELDVFNVAAQ